MQEEQRSGGRVLPGSEPMDEAKIVRAHAAHPKTQPPRKQKGAAKAAPSANEKAKGAFIWTF